MTEVVTVTLTTTFEVELDEGDYFDPDDLQAEVRSFLSQYGPVQTLGIEHDAIPEGDEEEGE